jgi:hypothetical protein
MLSSSLTLYVGGALEFQSMNVLEHLLRPISCLETFLEGFCGILEDSLEDSFE